MFEDFNLKDNAFPVTPSHQDKTPWFGFKGLKEEFDTVLERSASEDLRLCVLSRGRYGAGKTHAALYFSDVLAARHNRGMYTRFLPILIESPKQPQKAFVDFSSRLLNAITFRRIAQASRGLRESIGQKALFEQLLNATGSEDIATVLSGIDESNLLVPKAFLLGGGLAKELRELGVAKKLTVDHEFALAITGVLNLLINAGSEKAGLTRIVLWLDEMEDLVYFPTRYYLPFTQALREIIDSTDLHLTLMVNFTFAEPEDLPAIENVLGQAIMQRVNHHIIFQQPTADDLRTYLLDLLKFNRLENKKSPPTFPFAQGAFDLLIDSSVSRTPRFLNKLCDTLLREVQGDWSTSPGKRREITAGTITEKLPSLMTLLEQARG